MISLNDSSIYVGEIKQILKQFNLPQCQVGNKYPSKNKHFIFKNQIWLWYLDKYSNKLKEKKCVPYLFNEKYLNLTSNFDVKNLIYDRETHRYLGKYLRFLRDYAHINLMSMYNCFDKDVFPDSLKFKNQENYQNKWFVNVEFKRKSDSTTYSSSWPEKNYSWQVVSVPNSPTVTVSGVIYLPSMIKNRLIDGGSKEVILADNKLPFSTNLRRSTRADNEGVRKEVWCGEFQGKYKDVDGFKYSIQLMFKQDPNNLKSMSVDWWNYVILVKSDGSGIQEIYPDADSIHPAGTCSIIQSEQEDQTTQADQEIIFTNSESASFTTYQAPVSIGTYTISTHSSDNIEMCISTLDRDTADADMLRKIAKISYRKGRYQDVFYYNPFNELFKNNDIKEFINKHILKLCILIKVPRNLATSVTILEGKYIADRYQINNYYSYRPTFAVMKKDMQYALLEKQDKKLTDEDKITLTSSYSDPIILDPDGTPHTIEHADTDIIGITLKNPVETEFKIFPQLLSSENTTGDYLLGDRLFEYLCENCITNISPDFEVKRVQEYLDSIRKSKPNNFRQLIPATDLDQIKKAQEESKKLSTKNEITIYNNLPKDRYYGVWNDVDSKDLKLLAIKYNLSKNYDTLGYVDKDMEKIIKGGLDNVNL